jgi:hypothetical protein
MKPQTSDDPEPTPTPVHTSPPVETTTPDRPFASRGGDTPNSMAVERATEPSLRSYSPTSSIRAVSEADYAESVPALNLSPHAIVSPHSTVDDMSDSLAMTESVTTTVQYSRTPMSGSVATLVANDSPQGTGTGTPKDSTEYGEDSFIVVPSENSGMIELVHGGKENVGGKVEHLAKMEKSSSAQASVSAPAVGAGRLLGRGKIDAKAQDDFIAFMMGKK